MTPRWSRLALAAILAFGTFGVCPSVDVAAADDGAGAGAACPCDHDGVAAPTLVVDAEHPLCRSFARHGAPVCALEPATDDTPRVVAPVAIADARASAADPGPQHAPWRVAPKTSPPRR